MSYLGTTSSYRGTTMDTWRRRTAILFAAGALVAGGCTSAAGPTWSFAPTASSGSGTSGAMTSSAPSPSPAPAASSPSGDLAAASEAITVEAFDLGFRPSMVHVAAAGTYPVTFTNTGSMTHDLTFADGTK